MFGVAVPFGPYILVAAAVILLILSNRGKFTFAVFLGALTLVGVVALICSLPPRRMPFPGLIFGVSALIFAASRMRKS